MSLRSVPPWQNVLDSLTKKAEEWNLINELKNKHEAGIVAKCLSNESLRNYLLEYMDLCLSTTGRKSATDSVTFRTRGNNEFKMHHDSASLSLYTECIRFAPYGSEEHALGLANRSAVLFHMKKFKECITDAEKALSLPYPKRLRIKLTLRLSRCYLLLHSWEKCQATLELAENHLSDKFINDNVSMEEAKLEILSLRSELVEMQKCAGNAKVNETPQESLPSLLCGPNMKLPSASAALELRFSDCKGRFIIANQDINQGDVLFVEKPYTFVVLPDQRKDHCHHCSRVLFTPTPCRNCVEVLFCDEICETTAFDSYHHHECGGLSLMSAVGVAHLGLRIILTTGQPSLILEKACAASEYIQSEKGSIGNLEDPYSSVYLLSPHIEDMELEDVFQYAVTAELLALFLMNKTSYFKNDQEKTLKQDEVLTQICALLLRHIAQLVCNAHAITKLDCEDIVSQNCVNTVISESQQRIATAIYPCASMMNHSCDPNIINSFSNEILIVKASRKILKGEEVFNCYGPHFQRMGTAERQAALQAQYFFLCDCSACAANPGESFDPIQERLWALRCSSCSGPLLNEVPGREPAGSKIVQNDASNSHLMVCDACGLHQPISGLVCDAFSALSLFKKGCEEMDTGNMQDALNDLNRCRELQERALYRSNKELTATYDMLAKCYATLGCYSNSVDLLQLVLPAVEEQFGPNSIETAHELQKLSDVMLCNIRTMETLPSKEMLDKATKVVERGLSIFSVHYGKWNQGWQDLDKKLHELKLMDEMATIQGNFKKNVNL